MKILPTDDAPSSAAAPLPPPTGAVLILRAGDAIAEVAATHGEFAAWIEHRAGDAWPGQWVEHDLRSDAPIPAPESYAAIVVTGSICSVTERAPWMLRAEQYLAAAVRSDTPILGICFGHQLLAQTLGGEVKRNPNGREIGTVELTVMATDDPLFTGLATRVPVNTTHIDTVAVLPPGAVRLATTALEPNAALAFGPRVRGVQFHPEICGAIMRGYVTVRRERMLKEGLDADATFARSADTPLSVELLRNFFRYFVRASVRRAA